jgi:AraC-like DNA-binding protein/mannose-6-phosphate isomerase-like protein (cupin superfamily)
MKAAFEKVFPLEGLSFHVHTYEKEEFDAPWHYHPEYELTYILSSRGVRYVGNHFENFKEDDLILLGPNLPHCWKNSGNQVARASAVVIQWKEDLFGDEWFLKNKFESAYKLMAASRMGIKFDPSVATQLKTNFLELSNLDNFGKVIGFLKILNELSLSKNSHKVCTNNYYDKINHSDQERINTIFQYVKDHYSSKITLSEISSQLHMSRESFSRFFSHFHGKPFFSFLNEYRINVACSLLIETNLPISEIAFASGFESLPFFFRQFKKYKSCSPKYFKTIYNENLKL